MKALRLFGLLAALALGGCDYFHSPAADGQGPARVGVAFRQVAGGANSAFDAADNAAIEVRIQGAVVHSETIPITHGGSGATGVLDIALPGGATSASVQVALRAGAAVLFTGSATVDLAPGQAAEALVTLTPVVAALDLEPPPPLTTTGRSVPLEGRAVFASGHEVPGITLQWESLAPQVVAVESTPQGWRATALAEGSATVRASGGGESATVPVQVALAPAWIEVVPGSLDLQVGTTGQFEAVVRDSSEAVLSGRTLAWSSSNPPVARVDASGTATAVSPGSALIEAALGSVQGQAQLRVLPAGPAVQTLAATQITTTGATLRAEVNARGRPATLYFEHSLFPDLANATTTPPISVPALSGPQFLGQPVTGLPSDRRIYYRAVATDGSTTVNGEILHFDTPTAPGTPIGLVAYQGDGVELHWIATGVAATTFEIERDLVSPQGSSEVHPAPREPSRVFESIGVVTGTTTTFHDWAAPTGQLQYRVRACHTSGCSPWSTPLTFYYGLPPAVTTLDAVSVGFGSLRLQATVNPFNAPTQLHWQLAWDPSFIEYETFPPPSYGPVGNSHNPLEAGEGNVPILLQHVATPVYPGTRWLRAVAVNAWGIVYGNAIRIEIDDP